MPYSHKFITYIYDKNGTCLLSHVYKHSGTITNSPEWNDRRRNLDQQDLPYILESNPHPNLIRTRI